MPFPLSLDNLPTNHADNANEIIHASTINDQATAVNAVQKFLISIQVPAFATSFTPNFSTSPRLELTLTGNITINAPTGGPYLAGTEVVFLLKQDPTGNRTVTWDVAYTHTPPTILPANSYTVARFTYDGTNWVGSQPTSFPTVYGTTVANAAGITTGNYILCRIPVGKAGTAVKMQAYAAGSSGSVTYNFRKNGTLLLHSSDILVGSPNVWVSSVTLQNTSFAVDDYLELIISATTGVITSFTAQLEVQ